MARTDSLLDGVAARGGRLWWAVHLVRIRGDRELGTGAFLDAFLVAVLVAVLVVRVALHVCDVVRLGRARSGGERSSG